MEAVRSRNRTFYRVHINERGARSRHLNTPKSQLEMKRLKDITMGSAGKAAAVAAYCYGVLPLESCQALFARHPGWRRA